jgi:hypothetical protein
MDKVRSKETLALLLVVVTLVSSGQAVAATAVVKVFEATGRKAPSDDAAPVQVFKEGSELSVWENAINGWRRVRLADGKIAFVRDDEVRLAGASGPMEPLPSATAQSPRSQPNRILYVKDLDHLADLVKEDSSVHPKATSLAQRQFAGKMVMYGGATAGTLVALGGLLLWTKQSCDSYGFCMPESNETAFYGGLAFSALSTLVGYALMPSRNDLLDVVNEWNGRHLDQQFTIEPQTNWR